MIDTAQRVNDPAIESYREYLHMLARVRIGPRRAGPAPVDPSDVVQQTLLKACAGLAELRGEAPHQVAAWLRTILERQIIDEFARRSRSPEGRAVSIDRTIEDSSRRLDQWLRSNDPSPSAPIRSLERSLQLAGAMARLPKEYRQALEMHYIAGAEVAEVAEAMGRSRASVAGLIRRGVARLRELLGEGPPGEGS